MQRYLSALFSLSLLLFSISLPITTLAVTPSWYYINYDQQNTYEYVREQTATYTTEELIGFYLFKNDPPITLSEKEQRHFKEVRTYFVALFITMCISLVAVLKLWPKVKKTIPAITNIVLIALSSSAFINFRYFWDNIFHPLIFNNDYWINYPHEISFYLFQPEVFFVNSAIAVISITVIINLLVLLYAHVNKRIHKE